MKLHITEEKQGFGLVFKPEIVKCQGQIAKTFIMGIRFSYDYKEELKTWLYAYADKADLGCGWYQVIESFWYLEVPKKPKDVIKMLKHFFVFCANLGINSLPVERAKQFKKLDTMLIKASLEYLESEYILEVENLKEVPEAQEYSYSGSLPESESTKQGKIQWQANLFGNGQKVVLYKEKPAIKESFLNIAAKEVLLDGKYWWALPWQDPTNHSLIIEWQDKPKELPESKAVKAEIKVNTLKRKDGSVACAIKIQSTNRFSLLLAYIKNSFTRKSYDSNLKLWIIEFEEIEEIVDFCTKTALGKVSQEWDEASNLFGTLKPNESYCSTWSIKFTKSFLRQTTEEIVKAIALAES